MPCLTATSTRLPLLTAGTISSSQYPTTRRETSFMHSVLGIAQTPFSSTTLRYLCGQPAQKACQEREGGCGEERQKEKAGGERKNETLKDGSMDIMR